MTPKKPTQRVLAESLLQLSQNIPIKNITVDMIVRNCGLTRRTFYNYYEDKVMLIEWIFEQDTHLDEFYTNLNIPLNVLTLQKLEAIRNNNRFYTKIFREEEYRKSFAKIEKEAFLRRIQQFRSIDIQIDYTMDFLVNGSLAVVTHWILSGFREEPDEILRKLTLCITDVVRYDILHDVPPDGTI